ncbi:MAG: Ig-like domain-containing protein [Candidatus Coatesbacteria bacterium]|nr:Ig-like domain-containing protein [Candidatus Coatesbacteria bacterium]
MGKGFRFPDSGILVAVSLVLIVAGLLAIGVACSRSESGRDDAPTGPTAPYRLSITARPTELFPYENALMMIDVKDGYGKDIDEAVLVKVTTTGGYFENGDNRISGEVTSYASFWLTYEPDHSPNPDFPGPKEITAIIDYGDDSSCVSDTTEVIFMDQGSRVASIRLAADPTHITDADNLYSVITATVVGEYGAPLSGVTVYFSVQGGQKSAFDSATGTTNALGVAQTVFRPHGDVGLLKVCGQAGTKTDCVEIKSDKLVVTIR